MSRSIPDDVTTLKKMYSMPYSMYCNMTAEQQAAYLNHHHLEFQGYTLVGTSQRPTHIEFCNRN
jgi:hypothetical protein